VAESAGLLKLPDVKNPGFSGVFAFSHYPTYPLLTLQTVVIR
jgi:hypothetical protein